MQFQKFLKIASVPRRVIDKDIFDDLDNSFAEILAEKLGFSYQLVSPSDGEFGRLLPNGSWTGMVGMIERGEADLVIHRLSMSPERADVLDFSYPYHVDIGTFATTHPEYSTSMSSFLKPFSLKVWITIVLFVCITPIVFIAVFGKQLSRNIIANSSSGKPKTAGESILSISCVMFSVFLRFFYTAVLLSYLSCPSLVGVRTIAELADSVDAGKHNCASLLGNYLSKIFMQSNNSNLEVIARSLIETKGSNDIEEALGSSSAAKKFAFLAIRDRLLTVAPKYFVSHDGFLTDLRGIGMKKGFCCKMQLDSVINYIWVSGLYKKIREDFIFKASLKSNLQSNYVDERATSLSITDFSGVFLLLLVGYALSSSVLIFEMILARFQTSVSSDIK